MTFARSGLPFTVGRWERNRDFVSLQLWWQSQWRRRIRFRQFQWRDATCMWFQRHHYAVSHFDDVYTGPTLGERQIWGWGAFFNLFNHPNFDQPGADIASPTFGTITSTVNTPTSILGSFLGGDASPRQIQLKGSLTF
jgi:hypothetical protein